MVKMQQQEEELQKVYFNHLLHTGVDVVTMGNHTWDQKEIYGFY